jgi:ABC-type nickel/cobalt efflux system permease component RcnA
MNIKVLFAAWKLHITWVVAVIAISSVYFLQAANPGGTVSIIVFVASLLIVIGLGMWNVVASSKPLLQFYKGLKAVVESADFELNSDLQEVAAKNDLTGMMAAEVNQLVNQFHEKPIGMKKCWMRSHSPSL